MSRESEVATYLRADEALAALVPGGIYEESSLPEAGITDAITTPDVWAGGVFQTTIRVRQGAAVPTGDLQDVTLQHTSMSQRIEVWAYATSVDAIEEIFNQVYTLLMGQRVGVGWRATQAGGGPGIRQAPELPPGIKTNHEDYRFIFVRKPVVV